MALLDLDEDARSSKGDHCDLKIVFADLTGEQPENADESLYLSHFHCRSRFFDSAADCRLLLNWEMIDLCQRNTNATFSLVRRLAGAKNFGEIIELEAAHLSNQFSAMIRQAEEVAMLCVIAGSSLRGSNREGGGPLSHSRAL